MIQHRLQLEQPGSKQLLGNHGDHGEPRCVFFCASGFSASPFSILRAFQICEGLGSCLVLPVESGWHNSCWKSDGVPFETHQRVLKEASIKQFQSSGCKVGNVHLTLQEAMEELRPGHRQSRLNLVLHLSV